MNKISPEDAGELCAMATMLGLDLFIGESWCFCGPRPDWREYQLCFAAIPRGVVVEKIKHWLVEAAKKEASS